MPHNRPIERKLTTVLAADAANYSGRMSRDEDGTVRALRAARGQIDTAIAAHGGRIANTSGDGLIAEFPSVLQAVRCAVAIQTSLNADPQMLPFRLGVHLGDVIVEGPDLLGEGVNLAARLQEMAEAGGVLISQQVYDHIHRQMRNVELRPLGPARLRHLDYEVGVYAVLAEGLHHPRGVAGLGPRVRRPADAAEPPADQTDAPLPPDRARFVRDRNRILAAIGGIVGLEVLVDLPFMLSVGPVTVLGVVLYRKWQAVRPPRKGPEPRGESVDP